MTQLRSPLALYLAEIIDYMKKSLTSKLGTDVDLIVITKVGQEVEMRDTLGDDLGMSIMILEGTLESLKGQRGN